MSLCILRIAIRASGFTLITLTVHEGEKVAVVPGVVLGVVRSFWVDVEDDSEGGVLDRENWFMANKSCLPRFKGLPNKSLEVLADL
jgi:hypothetical protein